MIASIDDIPAEIERLASAGRLHGRRWSLAQIAEHLARSMEWTVGTPAGANDHRTLRLRIEQFVAGRVTLLTGWIPADLPSSSDVQPSPDVDLPAATERLRAAIAAVNHARHQPPPHPILGSLSRRGWLRFHVVHARHHLRLVTRGE